MMIPKKDKKKVVTMSPPPQICFKCLVINLDLYKVFYNKNKYSNIE